MVFTFSSPALLDWQSGKTSSIPIYKVTLFNHPQSQLLSFFSLLTRDTDRPLSEIDIYQIFACTLLSIWQAHWRLVLDNVSFSSTNVIASTSRLLTRFDSESQSNLD
jgi:hypothetical protein